MTPSGVVKIRQIFTSEVSIIGKIEDFLDRSRKYTCVRGRDRGSLEKQLRGRYEEYEQTKSAESGGSEKDQEKHMSRFEDSHMSNQLPESCINLILRKRSNMGSRTKPRDICPYSPSQHKRGLISHSTLLVDSFSDIAPSLV